MSFAVPVRVVRQGAPAAPLKSQDVLELSKLYETEFNQPDLHDRILIFDIVTSWPRRPCDADIEKIKGSNNGEAGDQSKDKSHRETPVIENMNTGIPQIENKGSSKNKDNYIKTATNNNESTLNVNKANTEMWEASNTGVVYMHEITLNKDVKKNQQTGKENNMKDQHESKTAIDNNNKQQGQNSSKGMIHLTSEETEIIREHKFYVHSTWLAVQSSYFRSLFFGGMKESNATEVHIKVSDSEEQAHLTLLKAMYKIDTLNASRVDELLDVLRLAHKYDVKFVFKKCKYCLQERVFSLQICEKIMRFIKVDNIITDVEDLASTLQSFLAKTFSPLDKTWQTTRFKWLCKPSVWYLLSSDELSAESENTIFHALMYWIEQRGIEQVLKAGGMPSIMSVVRFELIPVNYLYNIVQHDSIAKKFPDFNHHYLRGISYHALSSDIRETLNNKPVKRNAKPVQTDGPEMIPATPNFTWSFTWVISRDKLDAIIENNKELKSDEFWYCGYKMVLTISNVEECEGHRRSNKKFNAKLCLKILDVKQHSVVEISWNAASQASSLTINWTGEKRHTFKMGAHISSIDISFEIKRPREKLPLVNEEQLAGSTRPWTSYQQFSGRSISPATSTGLKFAALKKRSRKTTAPVATVFQTQEPSNIPCLSIDVNMKLE